MKTLLHANYERAGIRETLPPSGGARGTCCRLRRRQDLCSCISAAQLLNSLIWGIQLEILRALGMFVLAYLLRQHVLPDLHGLITNCHAQGPA